MTLERLILSTLAEGHTVTAIKVAKLWGEDKVRCREYLDKFAKSGLVTVQKFSPINHKGRLVQVPADSYTPILGAVRDRIALLNKKTSLDARSAA